MNARSRPLRDALARALDLVLPRFCLGCSRRLSAPEVPLLLCPVCRGRLEPVDPRRSCRGCLRPLPRGTDLEPICLACRADPPRFRHARALWRYRPPLDAVLRAFKYGGLDFLGPAIARLACERFGAELAREIDLVVPVPLGPVRRLTRGFNQAERIARPLAHRLALGFAQPLRHRPGGGRQARLGRRDRLGNTLRAFSIRPLARLDGRRILLVDDVLTTGATARSAAAALVSARAASVAVLAVAATPPEGTPEFA